MADGSLRIEVEVSPLDAQAAFALFGMPGAPMGIAALKPGYAAKLDTSPEPVQKTVKSEHVKPGPLCWEAIELCRNAEFQHWLRYFHDRSATNAQAAREVVKRLCGVESRLEFDTDEAAGHRFISLIRIPFMRRNSEWAVGMTVKAPSPPLVAYPPPQAV